MSDKKRIEKLEKDNEELRFMLQDIKKELKELLVAVKTNTKEVHHHHHYNEKKSGLEPPFIVTCDHTGNPNAQPPTFTTSSSNKSFDSVEMINYICQNEVKG